MSGQRVFVSWSGAASGKAALVLHAFMRRQFPTFHIFISSEDIRTGQRWWDQIAKELDESDVGIIVVTRENLSRPWIYYEAGALAKKVSKAHVIPLLCDLPLRDIGNTPLSAFQASVLSEDGLRRVVKGVATATEYPQVEVEFEEQFGRLWKELGHKFSEIDFKFEERDAEEAAAQTKNQEGEGIEQLLDRVTSLEMMIDSIRTDNRKFVETIVRQSVAAGFAGQGVLATSNRDEAAAVKISNMEVQLAVLNSQLAALSSKLANLS